MGGHESARGPTGRASTSGYNLRYNLRVKPADDRPAGVSKLSLSGVTSSDSTEVLSVGRMIATKPLSKMRCKRFLFAHTPKTFVSQPTCRG